MAHNASPKTLGDVARSQAALRGEAVALCFEDRRTSFAVFDRHSNAVGNGLIAAGIRKGDHISYLGKNSDSYFEILFGAAKIGAVMTPINWRLAAPEILYILRDCEARVLFVGPEFIATAASLAKELPALTLTIAVEGAQDGWPGYTAWRAAQSTTDPGIATTPDDIALQLYTSGTTGRPKGAMLRHVGLLSLVRDTSGEPPDWRIWGPGDVSLVAMPIFHIGGTGWGLTGLVYGAKGVIAREFNPAQVLDYIQRDKITKIFMVPAAMQIVVRDPRARQTDFSGIKYILYGASPIPVPLLRECMAVFGCGFVQMYGMTEASGTIVVLPPEDHDPQGSPRMRAAGKPLPGVEIAILDAEGRTLPPHQVGEITTRSCANMAGYWNLPEATAKTIDAEGWLRTGDAGFLDEDGYLYIQDRVKDLIISGGENVYPAEVENAICGHPDVADVAVIGVPDPKWGEAVKAIVVLKPGCAPSAEEIITFARRNIAAYKAPKSIDFAESLPRNPSGKILRRELREPYWANAERRVN